MIPRLPSLALLLVACATGGRVVPEPVQDTDTDDLVFAWSFASISPSGAGLMAGGRFLGDAVIARSPDGLEWTTEAVEADQVSAVLRRGLDWVALFVDGDQTLVVVEGPTGWETLATLDGRCEQLATDGETLVTPCDGGLRIVDSEGTPVPALDGVTSLSWADDTWLAFQPDTGLIRSDDGASWEPVASDPTEDGVARALYWDGSQWRVAVEDDGEAFIASSVDGQTFTRSPSGLAPESLLVFAGRWFGVLDGTLYVSDDWSTWEPVLTDAVMDLAVGGEGAISAGYALRISSDGFVWTEADVETP